MALCCSREKKKKRQRGLCTLREPPAKLETTPPVCIFSGLWINSAFYRFISQRGVIHFSPAACKKIVKFCMLVIKFDQEI